MPALSAGLTVALQCSCHAFDAEHMQLFLQLQRRMKQPKARLPVDVTFQYPVESCGRHSTRLNLP